MPAWPGGPCPDCGDLMPANLLHCMTCRALLNSDFEERPIEPAPFQPLPEIPLPGADDPVVAPTAYRAGCPHCGRALRLAAKYHGRRVMCKFCDGFLRVDCDREEGSRLLHLVCKCPGCRRELRIAGKYVGYRVTCKHCDAPFRLQT